MKKTFVCAGLALAALASIGCATSSKQPNPEAQDKAQDAKTAGTAESTKTEEAAPEPAEAAGPKWVTEGTILHKGEDPTVCATGKSNVRHPAMGRSQADNKARREISKFFHSLITIVQEKSADEEFKKITVSSDVTISGVEIRDRLMEETGITSLACISLNELRKTFDAKGQPALVIRGLEKAQTQKILDELLAHGKES